MIELRIAGGTLNLLPDTTITIEEKNPAYLGENVDVLTGEYSYPFTLPLDAHNRSLLGYPDRLDGGTLLARKLPAQLHLAGNLRIDGQLFLEEPSRTRVKVFIASNSLLDVKDKNLNEITTRSYELGNENADILTYLQTVSQDPLSYDFSVFPFYNRTLVSDPDVSPWQPYAYHNYFDPGTSQFTADGPISIFPRLEVVLEDVMAATGYAFTNAFQVGEQLRRLVLVNNRDLRSEAGNISTGVELASLLSNMKASEFVKQLSRLFCLAPFLDVRRRTITLQPLRDLLTRDTQLDWSSYASSDYAYTRGKAALKRMQYNDSAYQDNPTPDSVISWQADLAQGELLSDGSPITSRTLNVIYYNYVTGLSTVWGEVLRGRPPITSIQVVKYHGYHFGAIDNSDGTETNSIEIAPIFARSAKVPGSLENWYLPQWYTSTVQEGGSVDTRLAFHFGNSQTDASGAFPFASWNNYELDGGEYKIYPGSLYSLGWEGPYGLYEKWWKGWDNMLREGKLVERNFLLPPSELHRFTFDQKVRVENKDYFVQSLHYQVSLRGISEVRAKMLSVF